MFSLKENRDMETVEKYMLDRDVNDETSDEITHWACATREILARINEGLDLETGRPGISRVRQEFVF